MTEHRGLEAARQPHHVPTSPLVTASLPPGRDAYALYILEELEREPPAARLPLWNAIRGTQPARNGLCACGSGTKYKRCHLDLINELARIAARHDLRRFDYAALRAFADVAA